MSKERAEQIETDAATRSYVSGMGVSEWEAFLTDDEEMVAENEEP